MKKLLFALFLCCAFTAVSAQSTSTRTAPTKPEVKAKPVQKVNSRMAQKQKAAVIQKYKARNRYQVVDKKQPAAMRKRTIQTAKSNVPRLPKTGNN